VAVSSFPHAASALDTPNVLFGIDGLVIHGGGLFRNPGSVGGTVDDGGSNTFVFFSFAHFPGKLGRYKSFYLVDSNVNPDDTQNFGGISHNARYHSDTPEVFGTSTFQPAVQDFSNAYYPIIDRGGWGQVFDPAEYQIEVKYKPNGVPGGGELPLVNEAHTFNILLDQFDGFVFDDASGIYKRASDNHTWTIGTEAVGINDYFASAPKDADGFATYTVPLSSNPAFSEKSFYFLFGDNGFRDANVVAGGGAAVDGLDPLSFGGGPLDPSSPQLKVPNGVPFLGLQSAGDGSPDETRVFSVEIRSAAIKRITPNRIMARIDEYSGLSNRFGDALSYSTTAENTSATPRPPINIPGEGSFLPNYTDQITRFDQNGLTNLIINPRTPPDPNNTGHRFWVRNGVGTESFDGTTAKVNIRARLLEPLTNPGVAQNMTIYTRDLDGSDTTSDTMSGPVVVPADPKGADEYTFNLALNQFNTSTFTTVTINLADFTVNTSPQGAGATPGPLFSTPGDGLRTDFNLFEFGALVPNAAGLLKLEIDYMELVLPGGDADFDNSGTVDGRDFLTWQRGFGGPGTDATGDANGDGQVNTLDYNEWKSKFGGPPATAAGAGVPEPASAALAVAALATTVAGRRRKRAVYAGAGN
jgi:hypothetical protein